MKPESCQAVQERGVGHKWIEHCGNETVAAGVEVQPGSCGTLSQRGWVGSAHEITFNQWPGSLTPHHRLCPHCNGR